MKKNIKLIALIYIGVALFTYALTLRVNNLEGGKDSNLESNSLALKIK